MGSDQHKIRTVRFIWAVLAVLLFLPGPAYLAYQEYLRRAVLLWEFPAGRKFGHLAIAQDGTIYAGSDERFLYAINPDGTEKWRCDSGYKGSVNRPVIAENGIIYAIGYDESRATPPNGGGHVLLAVSSEGNLLWETHLPSSDGRGGYITPSKHGIFVGYGFGGASCVGLDGKLKWEYSAYRIFANFPLVGENGNSYFGARHGDNSKIEFLVCFDSDGNILWEYPVHGGVYTAPHFSSSGSILFGTGEGLKAVDLSGKLIWELHKDRYIAGNQLFIEDEIIYYKIGMNMLGAATTNGKALWVVDFTDDSINFGSNRFGPALASNGDIVMSVGIGNMKPLGYGQMLLSLIRKPNYDDVKIPGRVIVIDTKLGEVKWQYDLEDSVEGTPVVSPDGVIYVSGWDGKIRALKPRY